MNLLSLFIPLAAEKNVALTKESQTRHLCSGCKMPITDRYLLEALGLYWHEGCLKCNCCECKLGDIGSTLYSKANLILCKRDYLRSVFRVLLVEIFVDCLCQKRRSCFDLNATALAKLIQNTFILIHPLGKANYKMSTKHGTASLKTHINLSNDN